MAFYFTIRATGYRTCAFGFITFFFSIAHRYNKNQMIFLLIRWMHVVFLIVFAFEVELQRRRHAHSWITKQDAFYNPFAVNRYKEYNLLIHDLIDLRCFMRRGNISCISVWNEQHARWHNANGDCLWLNTAVKLLSLNNKDVFCMRIWCVWGYIAFLVHNLQSK